MTGHVKHSPPLSLVVGAYNMARELPRTIYTLSRDYQRGIEDLNYEIVIVDNGSDVPVDESELRAIAPEVHVVRVAHVSRSPATAINETVRTTRAPFLGLMIDGARMVSPGVINWALKAHRLDPGGLVGTYGFHLGPRAQMKSVMEGYDQTAEDQLLESVDWRENGYRLFEISVFAGSSSRGWFEPIAESNAFFLPRAMWNRLGGLDGRFRSPGGGFVNLDFWERAIQSAPRDPWMILGEGSFHQVHGGAATNRGQAERDSMAAEYLKIRGKPFAVPRYRPRLLGRLHPECDGLVATTTGKSDEVPRPRVRRS